MTRSHPRLTLLRDRMQATGTDLVALGPSSHMQWLIGLNPHGDERPVMVIVTQTTAAVLMPALNTDSARQYTDLPFFEWKDSEGPDAALTALLAECGATATGLHVAIDETMRADFAFLLLDHLDNPRRSFTQDTVAHLRAMKDDAEYAALKSAARINDGAFAAAFAALKTGVTERDIRDVINAHYKANGAEPAFCIIGFGANGAFPHHHTGDTVLQPDMPVLIDAGCRINGYPSDMTRCGWYGTPDPEFLKVAEIVDQAVQAALAAARTGTPCATIDAAARKVITDAGHGPQFLHRTGHGMGIDVHEPPYIAANDKTPLAPGHVFTIEPGIYLSGRFGIRLEESVILREDGPEIFADFPRDIVIAARP